MKYACTVKHLMDGAWHARSVASPVGLVEVTGGSRDEALEKLRQEIRYRVELCPCSGVAADYVQLEVRDLPRSRV